MAAYGDISQVKIQLQISTIIIFTSSNWTTNQELSFYHYHLYYHFN